MTKSRLEAFSDGVIAILITIMVLDLKMPEREPAWTWRAVLDTGIVSRLWMYVLSFVYLGIYWNNHHHLLQRTESVSGGILWANLDLLFWLSLFPFATGWWGENHFATVPTAVYGVVLLCAAIEYFVLQWVIVARQGPDSALARALGSDWKGKLSPLLYAAAIGLAFVSRWVALGIYIAVALIWLVPDRRLERGFGA